MTDRDRSAHPLVGDWRLLGWTATAEDGAETFPMGETPDGLLAYTAEHTMLVVMGARDRPPFTTADVTGGTLEERAEAFATMIAYGGSYAVDGATVVHRVEISLFPNWIGTTQRRRWELDETGNALTLTSPPIVLGGATRVHRLYWERMGRGRPEDGPAGDRT